jgi:hypothetical protein
MAGRFTGCRASLCCCAGACRLRVRVNCGALPCALASADGVPEQLMTDDPAPGEVVTERWLDSLQVGGTGGALVAPGAW